MQNAFLSDKQWAQLDPLLPRERSRGREGTKQLRIP